MVAEGAPCRGAGRAHTHAHGTCGRGGAGCGAGARDGAPRADSPEGLAAPAGLTLGRRGGTSAGASSTPAWPLLGDAAGHS
eukprot:4258946-Lingulodinium_polyedra.AAC.1